MFLSINTKFKMLAPLLFIGQTIYLQGQTISNYFVTTWNTEAGDPGGTSFKLPLSGGAYDVDINNDGNFDDENETNRTGTITIDFESAGEHTIAIRPSAANTENQLQIKFGIIIGQRNQQNQPQKLKTIDQWGDIVWTSMERAFFDCMNMTISNNAGAPNLSMVTNMSNMFNRARKFTGDLSTWDVSNVTTMTNMFMNTRGFTSYLSSWNVSQVTDMSNMFSRAGSFKAQDYEALLLGWSKVNVQPGVVFGAPPVKYCNGKKGRHILTSAPHNWTISGDRGLGCSDLALSIDAFLQGPYNATTNLMNDGLRTTGANQDINIIPITSPYEGVSGTIEDATIFETEGDDAIVDWVEVSLHSPSNIKTVVTVVAALLQRNGDVVALDGSSALQIQGIAGNYYVSINHRNHIPVITYAAQSLSTNETEINFTEVDNNVARGGSNAMAVVATNKYALFVGDVDGNGEVQVSDLNAILGPANKENDMEVIIGTEGYLGTDINMDGRTTLADFWLVRRLGTFGKGKQF